MRGTPRIAPLSLTNRLAPRLASTQGANDETSRTRTLRFSVVLLAAVPLSGTARADLSEPVIVGVSSTLDGSPFEQTVLLATPLGDGGHMGFILNKPTGVKLDALFPDGVC